MRETELVKSTVLPAAPPIPGLVFRGFQNEADFAKMADILQGSKEVDQFDHVDDAQDLARFYAHLVNFDISEDLVLAEVGGRVIGYASARWFLEISGYYIHKHKGFVLPAWRRKGIGSYLLRILEERQREVASHLQQDAAHFFESSATDTEYAAEALLRSEGYQPVRHFYTMVRPDLEDIPEAPLPSGLEVQPVEPEHYQIVCDANSEAFRDHWGYSPAYDLTVEKFLTNPTFDPTLWRVAWDGEQVAGMVLSYIDRKQNAEYNRLRGWTEDIAVRRPWRNRGLARALIVLSLHALKERCMSEAALTVDPDNLTGALRLYESVGFRPVKRFSLYHKPLTI